MKELNIRLTAIEDSEYLTKWFLQPDVLQYFPMYDLKEVDDTVRIWLGYTKYGAGLTAVWNKIPCGMAVLNLQPFKKFAHQCLISIIVDEKYRNKGIGTALIKDLMKLAKEKFKIELLHLEVYEKNPAIRLYQRLGFKEFGKQDHFIKDQGKYVGKIFMELSLT
ncbi:MAG: GNAT family N-acetyltransferase [Chlamydiae bacterium]|nr:GNAT family N-acetyltransferase [Chlamydiota bacterium]